jgi:short-subunit dehydrogenase
MKTLRDKYAMVTGAASGIGRAIALGLARHGVHLFLVDIDQPGLESAAAEAREAGVAVVVRRCDLARPEEVSGAVAALLDGWKRLDILVNNAGVAYYGPTEVMTGLQWDRVLDVNLRAPIQLIRELLPALLARPEAHILNVCSIAGLVGSARLAAYHVSKFGLIGLSESLRAEYTARGLGVTALCPGLVATRLLTTAMNGRPDKPLPCPPRWMCTNCDAVAARAIRAVRRNQGLVLISPWAHLIWAVKRLSPGFLDLVQRVRLRRRRPGLAPLTAPARHWDAGHI